MKQSIKKIMILSLTASLMISGCSLTTQNQSKTDGSTTTGPSITTGAGATQPVTTPAEVTSSTTTPTETTTSTTSAPETNTVTTTTSTDTSTSTKTDGTQPVSTTVSNTIDPGDIQSGDAYDTATVRDWIKRGSKADYFPDKKLVFLTFDDGPSTKVTPAVLDVLKKNSVHATFFYYTYGDLTGRADIVRRTKEEGHAIAIHTASHDYKKLYPNRKANVDALVKDVQKATANIQDILGTDWKPSVYRFPGGSFSWTSKESSRKAMANAKSALSDIGLEYLDWNALSGDSDLNNKDKSVSGLVNYTIKTTKNAPGYIIVLLMHDAGHLPNSPKALQGIIDYYKENGYEFGILK